MTLHQYFSAYFGEIGTATPSGTVCDLKIAVNAEGDGFNRVLVARRELPSGSVERATVSWARRS